MNQKAPIYRICVVTREPFKKEDLLRVVKINKKVYFDVNQNMKGRGAYIKKELSTILEAQKRHSLSKALKTDVDDSIYIELIQSLSKERR